MGLPGSATVAIKIQTMFLLGLTKPTIYSHHPNERSLSSASTTMERKFLASMSVPSLLHSLVLNRKLYTIGSFLSNS